MTHAPWPNADELERDYRERKHKEWVRKTNPVKALVWLLLIAVLVKSAFFS